MKIALLNDFLPNTGIGNYAFSLFSELRKIIDIEMVYLDSRREMPAGQNRIVRLEGFGFPLLNQVLNNAFVFPAKIPTGFDVYHASNQYISNLVAGKKAGVVSCMDVISARLSSDYNPAVGFFWNSSLGQMKKAARIIAISAFTKREITKHLGIQREKIKVVHLGSDPDIFHPLNKKLCRQKLGIEEPGFVVLNVGSEEKRKNIPTLLKAFAIVAEKDENALLLRVGEQRKETTRMVQRLGLSERVKYLNGLSASDLAMAYNSADALAFCSYYEGFGLPLVEAMSCSCPVVAANASSVPEIVGKAAVLVDNPFAAECFAASIIEIAENPALRKTLERKGFKQAKNFSWRKNAVETVKVYEEVLS